MIQVEGLTKSFGRREVLRGISFSLGSGVITGLAGPNACGKTTLIKCLLGLAVPDSGSLSIAGVPVDARGEFRRKIGYMPQTPSFPSHLHLDELIRMLEDLRREKGLLKEELIARFGLGSARRQPFGELSGGTTQKVAIVTAMMFDARILICDEPTAGLDPVSSVRFKELLASEARRGKSIVIVSHQLSELDQLAANVIFMSEGRALFVGGAAELKEKMGAPDLEHAITAFFARSQEGAGVV